MKPFLVAAFLSLVVVSPLWSRTWEITVDGAGDAPTVQAGIDSAAAGDTVLVGPGTYSEAIDFLGKDIVVKSSAGAAMTTLDGSGAVYVISIQSGESRAAVIQGFTITHGQHGVLIFNCNASVRDNVIVENSGGFSGAGIWGGGELPDPEPTFRPLIQGNTITRNTATRIGGGIGTWRRMAPEILDNIITDNEATDGDGGGIYFRALPDDDGAVIRGNVIANNHAGDHGGGFYAASALSGQTIDFELSWNLIENNTADGIESGGDSGGGIWLGAADSWIHHNTLVFNTGNGPTEAYGGGLVIERMGTSVIEKNIIALSKRGGGIVCAGTATPTIRNNLAWQNAGGDGVGDCPTWWQTDGNIVADPAFCDTLNGDFHLAQDSPAITHVAGPLGVYPIPGCGPVPVRPTTWGRLKTRYQ